MRRILIFLCIILAVVPFQAIAAGHDLGFYSVDLMASNYIHQVYSNLDGSNTGEAEYLGIDQYGSRGIITYTWTPAADQSSYQDIYFNFFLKSSNSSTRIQSVSVKLDASNSYTGATLVGYYGSLANGRIYQYRYSYERAVTSISVQIQFNIDFTGAFGMTSVIGYRNFGETVSSFNFYGAEYYRDASGNLSHSNIAISNPKSTPYQYDNWGGDSIWYYNVYYLDLKSDFLSLTQYDSIVYNLTMIAPYGSSTDSILNNTDFWSNKIGASLYVTNSNTSYQSLPFEVYSSVDYRHIVYPDDSGSLQMDPEFVALKVTVVVDVSGIDLDGYTVDLSIQDVPMYEPNGGLKLAFIRVESIRAIPVVTQQPWYVNLWSWIETAWNDSDNWIYSGIVHVADTVAAWGQKIVTAFNPVRSAIVTWGQNIVTALTPSEPALPEVEDQLVTAASEFHDEMDIIESVTAPSADPDDLIDDVFTIVPLDDPSGNAILTGLVDFDAFLTMAIVVLTFSIVGLVFFGKRS